MNSLFTFFNLSPFTFHISHFTVFFTFFFTVFFAVSEEKNRWLLKKMEELGISENDIKESFIRSSGKGGQHVNKTSTCVYIRHMPTGIEIKCMQDRSQSVNRFLARRELIEAIERISGKPTQEEAKRERIKKQKSKKRKRALSKYGN